MVQENPGASNVPKPSGLGVGLARETPQLCGSRGCQFYCQGMPLRAALDFDNTKKLGAPSCPLLEAVTILEMTSINFK